MTNAATRFQPDISGSAVPSGFIGQITESFSAASINQTGSLGADVIFNTSGAPSLTLNKGIYLITGSTGICTTNVVDEVGLWIYNVTTSTGVGGPSIGYSVVNNMIPFTVTQITAIGADSTTIRLFGQRSGSSTLKMGGTNGVIKSGFLQAVKIA